MGGPYFGKWSASDVYEKRLDADWPPTSDVTTTSGARLIQPRSLYWAGSASGSVSINPTGSISFTAISYCAFDIFASDYDNYFVSGWLVTSEASGNGVYCYMYSAGLVTGAVGWQYQELYVNGTSVTGARSSSGQSGFWVAYPQNTARSGFEQYIYGPNLAQPTASRAISISDIGSAYILDAAATESSSTQYAVLGYQVYLGTMSGQISVYGLGG